MQTSATVNPAAADIADGIAPVLTGDVDEMLASILPANKPEPAPARQKNPRFRVKWHADIVMNGHSVCHGFINDISTAGASVYLDNNVHPLNPTLRIYLPPLSATGRPHIIEVSGKTVYVVFDGDKQLYRAAISFSRFHRESDLAYLEDRLHKCHVRIPEH